MHDLTGNRYGKLLVIRQEPRPPTQRYYTTRWIVCCDCGTEKTVFSTSLRSGKVVSCGCVRRERARENIKKATGKGRGNLRHGMSKTPEWRVWAGIRQRCYDKNSPAYVYYGGRGVTVCERWSRFENFSSDMGLRPSPEHTLERVDNDGSYTPENCRWATRKEQARNRRSNFMVTAFGESLPLAAWAERFGVGRTTIVARILRGLPPEEAVLP
jgi:hypothetical protein